MAPAYSFSEHVQRSHEDGHMQDPKYVAVIIMAAVGVLLLGLCILYAVIFAFRL